MNYYQFHIADFALHTSHLSVEEEGVYRRLLDYYYDTESPIPIKTDRVIRRLRLGSHKETVDLILDEFFELKGDAWHNLRADAEIREYNSKAERARENGRKGGRPKKNKELKTQKTKAVILGNPDISESKANQEPLTKNHKPLTSNQEPQTNKQNKTNQAKPDQCVYTDDFEKFWKNFPKGFGNKGSKLNAAKVFTKLKPSQDLINQMLSAAETQAAEKQHLANSQLFYENFPHIERWLKNQRWSDEAEAVPEATLGAPISPMTEDWFPDNEVYEAIRMHSIPPEFTDDQLIEFRFYWRDRGDSCSTWNSKFLSRVTAEWASKKYSWQPTYS